MQIRDRIKELRRVPANQLRAHPHNWRTHPPAQREALRGLLDEIGYAGALLARELSDGSLELIDGHLRAETTPEAIVPVLVLDVDEAEAAKILATFDPLSQLAATDSQALEALLADVETQSGAVQQMLDDLAALPAEPIDPASLADCPLPSAMYQVVVECRDEEEQEALFNEFTGRGWKCRLLSL